MSENPSLDLSIDLRKVSSRHTVNGTNSPYKAEGI